METIPEEKEIVKKNRQTEYNKKFVDKNKEKIKEKIKCDVCLGCYTYFNKTKHNKSKRHQDFLNKK